MKNISCNYCMKIALLAYSTGIIMICTYLIIKLSRTKEIKQMLTAEYVIFDKGSPHSFSVINSRKIPIKCLIHEKGIFKIQTMNDEIIELDKDNYWALSFEMWEEKSLKKKEFDQ